MVIERYSAKIGDSEKLYARIEVLRGLCSSKKAGVGQAEGPRKAGALSLRVGTAPQISGKTKLDSGPAGIG
jgi:hypothetical protein